MDCETSIDQCALLNPNCNNGSCVDGVGIFTCECNAGFTGEFCDQDIHECETAGCQNGECEDLIGVYQCLCYPGWTGELCDIDIDYCTLNSSLFGPCDNIGTAACIDGNSMCVQLDLLATTAQRISMNVNQIPVKMAETVPTF